MDACVTQNRSLWLILVMRGHVVQCTYPFCGLQRKLAVRADFMSIILDDSISSWRMAIMAGTHAPADSGQWARQNSTQPLPTPFDLLGRRVNIDFSCSHLTIEYESNSIFFYFLFFFLFFLRKGWSYHKHFPFNLMHGVLILTSNSLKSNDIFQLLYIFCVYKNWCRF